ncbi:TIGR04282 family arsenosugar biosynthesis glycosyltransferase [Fundidesulfovibrio terrae]|uniref:TIGR04282 family arsenosugar biosynthesis glycosyltransferase n=1 Tax=Fundidesulfovibrio terrae TaxID=2922866 RepID=UPI001FAF7DA2|nr:TIGR04282 family arsenosugar biosynthesis glycosyltransferase [Fundidesulfovibrio terrae]
MTSSACILYFLRAPRLGRVKTRLARDLGDEAALALYKAFVEDMLDSLAGCGADVALWVSPGGDVGMVRHWLGGDRFYLPQPEGDLGHKMEHAFGWAFAQGYVSAAALGSDVPGLTPKLARSLTRLMRSEPALVGPSPDGGYWTIGFQSASYLPQVFEGMPWSTSELFGLTMDVLAPLQPALLPELMDMDTVEDLRRLAAGCPEGVAKRTLAIARGLGLGS